MNNLKEKIKARFLQHQDFYPEVSLEEIEKILDQNDLTVLHNLEESDGEVAFVLKDEAGYWFMDTNPKSMRTNCCYDEAARLARKKFPPATSVEAEVAKLGAELLDELDYRLLQLMKDVDTKTSSWIKTPDRIRHLGGALFMDKRYNETFVYHNGADSYYSSRGFRCKYCIKAR